MRTETTNHGLGKWAPGDHPRYDCKDMNWNWDEIDRRLLGKGDAFPTLYMEGAFFLRTDLDSLYENTGTQVTPTWTQRLVNPTPPPQLEGVVVAFSVGDWVLSSDDYVLDITHNLDANVVETEIYESTKRVQVNEEFITDNNTYRLAVPADPDLRFNGKVSLIKVN